MRKLLIIVVLLFPFILNAQDRWSINHDKSIEWKVSKDDASHSDFIESSGRFISVIAHYGVDDNGAFDISRRCVWPMLRIIPNDTHGSLIREFDVDMMRLVNVNGKYDYDRTSLRDSRVESVKLKGYIEVKSKFADRLSITMNFFPSVDKPVWCEKYTIVNTSPKPINIDIPNVNVENITDPKKGVDGSYFIRVKSIGGGVYTLAPQDTLTFGLEIQATKSEYIEVDIDREFSARKAYLTDLSQSLILNTPDTILNTMFAFAKIRATESIFETAGGFMHAPGGGDFYAAIWANDQAEYINPFYPFLGNDVGNESAINSYRHFARFMNDEYNPIPSSIISEGKDIWAGAKDRGDAAMVAYGAARFALESGSKGVAKDLFPLIEWCLEYSRKKINSDGVVVSDSDELEGRFPAGEANLCTSSLYYDALLSASYLAEELGMDKSISKSYKKQAEDMRLVIERYFGSNVEGFDTYRYYKGNDVLRAWICIPLSVGIDERATATADALFSERLWTDDGLSTQAGEVTFWDRSTLYALRGVFMVGDTDRALDYLKKYSERRLLGNHVPYAVEAYPEGNQAQLSAESGLYCRIFIEGMFGIRPMGLKSFSITPRLPKDWNTASLNSIKAFGSDFSISLSRLKDRVYVRVYDNASGKLVFDKKIKEGETAMVKLK